MSKDVYSIDNQKAFELGMRVGKLFMEKYDRDPYWNWSASGECLDVTYEVWKRTHGDGDIENVLDSVMAMDIELLEVGDKMDVNEYSDEENRLSQDLYYGFISGEHIGNPTKENLEICNKAMMYFMNHINIGFLQDVYNDCDYLDEE